MRIGDEFTCPKCGSHYYHSTRTTYPMQRQCRGPLVAGTAGSYEGCEFTWWEADDRLYFRPRGTT